MVDEDVIVGVNEDWDDGVLFLQIVGECLCVVCMAVGFDFNDIVGKICVLMCYFEVIECGDYLVFFLVIYVIGFVWLFVCVIGVDEVVIVCDLCVELGCVFSEDSEYMFYELVDLVCVLFWFFVWMVAVIVVVLLGGYFVWWLDWLGGDVVIVQFVLVVVVLILVVVLFVVVVLLLIGQVVLIVMVLVWLCVYDKVDKVLFQKEMVVGEIYNVLFDVDMLMICIGWFDVLKVIIDGQ